MSQNINIIYKVDKTQVDASTASVQQAKAATDQLTQAANKLGQQGGKNNIQFGNTIEGVKLKMQQLKGQIDLTNQTDKKRLDGLITQYKAAQKQLEQYTDKLKDSNKEGVSGTNSLTSSFGGLYNAIKLVIGAQVVKQFVSMSIEAAALAGKVEGVERSFMRAFPDGVLLLNNLRQATKGTITDFELMQRTLQATNLGVAVEPLPKLFEFAAARAQQTGESVDYLVDSIVRGVGRKSLLILDNLGISAIRLKEHFHGASLASQSVADVTAAVGKIAQEELTKMGGFAETAATKVDRLNTSWENLKLQLSKFVQDGALITYFNELTNRASDFVEIVRRQITAEELYQERAVKSAAIKGVEIIKQEEYNENQEIYLKNIKEVIALKTHELIQQQQEIKLTEQRQIALQKLQAQQNVGPEFRKNKEQIEQYKIANQILVEQIKLLNGVAKSLELKALTANANSTPDSLEELEKKVKDLNEQLQKTEPISTKAGIAEARRIKEQIIATEDKIEAIKKEIYWEEILMKRREGIKPQKIDDIRNSKEQTQFGVEVTFDKDKIQKDFVGTTSQALKDGGVILSKDLTIVLPAPIIPEDAWDKFEASFKSHYTEITDFAFSAINDLAQAQLQSEVSELDERISKTRDFYDTQIELAGNNKKAKEKLRSEEDKKIKALEKERAERERKAALGGIVVNTALGVIKAIATAATIYDGLVEAALVAAEGAVQYSVASKARYYAKGEVNIQGPGTGTSDSIPSFLSRGESVITAENTASSEKTLRLIQAKKLNDKVLDRIMTRANSNGAIVGFDDTRLLEATKQVARAAAGNDIIRKGSMIYEAKEEGKRLKTYIRSKSLN